MNNKYNFLETILTKWANDFRIAGPDALRSKKNGRKNSVGLIDKKKQVQSSFDAAPVDTSTEHVKQLEDELLKLRIENAPWLYNNMCFL